MGEGYPGGGVPWQGGTLRGGTLAGGVPWQGVPCRGLPCRGGTLPGGYPARGGTQVRYPPARSGWGGTQLGQHREYLLHGGRYASCVHAGGLSCFKIASINTTWFWFATCNEETSFDWGTRLLVYLCLFRNYIDLQFYDMLGYNSKNYIFKWIGLTCFVLKSLLYHFLEMFNVYSSIRTHRTR